MADRRHGPYLGPAWLVKNVFNKLLMALGVASTLAVKGRRSGIWRTVPVNVLEMDGTNYLLSPRGVTDWVLNIRASSECEIRSKGKRVRYRAEEIKDDRKPRVIEEYLARWGSQVKPMFESLPDPADHPVFVLRPAGDR